MARRPKRGSKPGAPPPDAPSPDDAEKTQVSFVLPDFDEDGDPLEAADPTDRQAVPHPASRTRAPKPVKEQKKRKLTLPVPGAPDDAAAQPSTSPVPPKASKPEPMPALQLDAPAGGDPPRKPIPIYPTETSSGSLKLVVGAAGALIALVAVAFAVAPDGKTEEELIQEQIVGLRAGEVVAHRQRQAVASAHHPARPSEDPGERRPDGRVEPKRSEPKVPDIDRHRHPREEKDIAKALAKDVRFGFEKGKKHVRRTYDNYDSEVDRGIGIPLLMVFSRPPGMTVEADGTIVGRTPLIRPLPKDTKRVKVKLSGSGFQSWEQTVTPNEIEHFRVGVTMTPIQ